MWSTAAWYAAANGPGAKEVSDSRVTPVNTLQLQTTYPENLFQKHGNTQICHLLDRETDKA